MLKPRIIILLTIFSFLINGVSSQTTVQLFLEDFNSFNTSFTLNSGNLGADSGPNKWIINSEYDGMGIRPNTTSQDSTYGGTISFAPFSGYAHIHDSVMVSSVSNANYDNLIASDRFLEMSDGICTKGISNVELSFFYIGEGGPGDYGELYYHTGTGSWVQTGINQYKAKNKWKKTSDETGRPRSEDETLGMWYM